MSSGGGGNGGNKSPGKGAKSLEMMQKRMMHQAQQQPPVQMAPVEIPAQVVAKPKGKDFASLSARAPRQDPPQQLQPQQQQPQQQQAAVPPQQGGKPKGKDFSAMASRMAPSQPQQQTFQPSAEEMARAANLQAGARAAAGLPPLDYPTATSVTTTPPTIPAPRYNLPPPQQQQQQQQMYGVSYVPPRQPDPISRASSTSSVAPAAWARQTSTGRRNPLAGTTITKPAPAAARAPPSTKPTLVPTAAEARLSLQTSSQPGPSPFMAPLVGERIQDLVKSLDPSFTIDAQAEQQVLQLADDFLDKVCKQSLRLAAHRGSKMLDVQDVQLILAKQWGIVIPGLGPPVPKKPKTPSTKNATNKRKASGPSTSQPSSKASRFNSGETAAAAKT